MFGFLKPNPLKQLQKQYEKLSEQAMHAQRNGNIELFAKLSKEADDVAKKMDELEKENKKS